MDEKNSLAKSVSHSQGNSSIESKPWNSNANSSSKTLNHNGIRFQGYRLGFHKPLNKPDNWNGAWATIIEDKIQTVWGTLYEIDLKHLASLDAQELVHENVYVPIIKEVMTPDGDSLEARSYQMLGTPIWPIQPYLLRENHRKVSINGWKNHRLKCD